MPEEETQKGFKYREHDKLRREIWVTKDNDR